MSCESKTLKQWQAICKKHKLPKCSSYKRKAELCAYIESPERPNLFASRSCKDWLKKDLIGFCRSAGIHCDAKATKEQMCKLLSAHFRSEAQPLPPSIATGLPKTFQEFKSKTCDVPREGWLVRDLEAIAKTLGIANHSGKRKAQLCRMISDYFDQASRRSSRPKAPSASPKRPSARRRSARPTGKGAATIEDLPADVSRYIAGMVPLKSVLALCASSPVWAKRVCSTKVFWQNYYQNKLQALKDEGPWGDIEFLQLVILKTHYDLLKKMHKSGTEKTNMILDLPGDAFAYVPVIIPSKDNLQQQQPKSQQTRPFHNIKKKRQNDAPYKKMLQAQLRAAVPELNVIYSNNLPSDVERNKQLMNKLHQILTFL